jgi:hypothetical protein
VRRRLLKPISAQTSSSVNQCAFVFSSQSADDVYSQSMRRRLFQPINAQTLFLANQRADVFFNQSTYIFASSCGKPNLLPQFQKKKKILEYFHTMKITNISIVIFHG